MQAASIGNMLVVREYNVRLYDGAKASEHQLRGVMSTVQLYGLLYTPRHFLVNRSGTFRAPIAARSVLATRALMGEEEDHRASAKQMQGVRGSIMKTKSATCSTLQPSLQVVASGTTTTATAV